MTQLQIQSDMSLIPVSIDDDYTVPLGTITRVFTLNTTSTIRLVDGTKMEKTTITRVLLNDGAYHDSVSSVETITKNIWAAMRGYIYVRGCR